MESTLDAVGEAGLQFFAKMTASISHELKNALAVINESAGLLEDFTLMAERGAPMDPGRIRALAGTVKDRVRRADGIVKNMNRFAHSIDEPVRTVDPGEVLGFVAALSGRLLSMGGATLQWASPAGEVTIATIPFLLQCLLWRCLKFAADSAGAGKTVSLSAEKSRTGARIGFAGIQGSQGGKGEGFPGRQEKALLGALRAELRFDAGTGEIVVSLPRDIG
ncbi:MAG: histidine kinase, partial [Deltaproteobacteria bacterium]|nr:histidine kinase [Deltaproteobacteria bacterium]